MNRKIITPQDEAKNVTGSLIKEYPALNSELFSVVLKREDLHPYGSHKGRSIPYMIDTAISKGHTSFVISSSGNAGIAGAKHLIALSEANKVNKEQGGKELHLEIFCGFKVAPEKLKTLKELEGKFGNTTIHISTVERPLQSATIYAQQNPGAFSLRQSTDDLALEGYKSLAEELSLVQNLRAVFIGTSSGTTAQSLAKYFTNLNLGNEDKKVEVHIVQTTSCHPLADSLGAINVYTDSINNTQDSASIADAIVDKVANRKEAINAIYNAYPEAGSNLAHIVSNSQIRHAIELLNAKEGVKVSPNGALGLAGLIDTLNSGQTWEGSVVCMVCGQ